jgi:hypothetical protein
VGNDNWGIYTEYVLVGSKEVSLDVILEKKKWVYVHVSLTECKAISQHKYRS